MIYTEVKIDMENSNALVTIAYISQSEGNPYKVFCEYIKYCITMHYSNRMLLGELRGALSTEFGIYFPRNVLARCIRLLSQEGFCATEAYQIYRKNSFDCDTFNQKRNEFRKRKDDVIQHLIQYVSKFGKKWDESFAESTLSNFLQSNGNAFDLFFRRNEWHPAERFPEPNNTSLQKSSSETEEMCFPDQWYVGSFIRHELTSDGPCKHYLQDISNGLMICMGSYHLSESESVNTNFNISGTEFFFDTKLLLRLIGCAWGEAIESVKELVKFIHDGGGRIYYFPHTLTEVINALERAEQCIRNNSTPVDKEMAYFLLNRNITPAILRAKRLNVRDELRKYEIFQRELTEWSENDRLNYGLDSDDLSRFIKSRKSNWNDIAIDNDVSSIREVHMLRRGNYQEYYGTSERLPVFVTSNNILTFLMIEYAKIRNGDKRVRDWKVNRLPVVTDIRLTCRLWDPAQRAEDIPLLQLTANAVAAQRPDAAYFNQLRQTVESLAETLPAFAEIPISDYCDDEFTERIVMQIKGDIDKLDVAVLANTIEEYTQMKLADEQQKRRDVELELTKAEQKIDARKQQIIDYSVEKYKDKLGFWGVILWCGRHWAWVIEAIITLVTSIICYASQQWYPMLAIFLPPLLVFVEKLLGQSFIKNKIVNTIIPYARKSYEEKIRKQLTPIEHEYEEIIIQQCVSDSEHLKIGN